MVGFGGNLLRQKSRELWPKEGDKNTNLFFSQSGLCSKKKKFYGKLKVNGELLTKEVEIKEGKTNVFSLILCKSGEWRSSISGF